MALPGPKPGRYWGEGDFNALRDATSTAQSDIAALQALVAVPVGSVLPYAGSAAPAGFLLCNGQSVLRADYAALFTAIGTTYGAVDGTHFTVPDLRSRAPIGAGQGTGLTNRALAATGGAETHTLAVTELPSHDHGGATGTESAQHTHHFEADAAAYTGALQGTSGTSGKWLFDGTAAVNDTGVESATHTHSVTAQGGGGAHNTMPPFLALNWIIAV